MVWLTSETLPFMKNAKIFKQVAIVVTTCILFYGFVRSAFAAAGAQTIPVLRIQFFPLASGRLDPSKTGMSLTYQEIVAKTNRITAETEQTLEEGTRYKGYKNSTAIAYLDYKIIDTKEFLTSVPRSNNISLFSHTAYRPDYKKILADVNICHYVNDLGVREVWMWGYHYADLEPNESNMAGPYGDISNSERINDMPVCSKTYTLYNYNYDRDTPDAVHNHMHQFENVFGEMDYSMFFEKFVRPYGKSNQVNNCGWAHMPPNSAIEYLYDNTTTVKTQCEDWRPDRSGQVKTANCSLWGCTELGYYKWWMQNIPGNGNTLTYDNKPLRNWWDAIADLDTYIAGDGKSLVFSSTDKKDKAAGTIQLKSFTPPSNTPTSTPTPIKTPTATPVVGAENPNSPNQLPAGNTTLQVDWVHNDRGVCWSAWSAPSCNLLPHEGGLGIGPIDITGDGVVDVSCSQGSGINQTTTITNISNQSLALRCERYTCNSCKSGNGTHAQCDGGIDPSSTRLAQEYTLAPGTSATCTSGGIGVGSTQSPTTTPMPGNEPTRMPIPSDPPQRPTPTLPPGQTPPIVTSCRVGEGHCSLENMMRYFPNYTAAYKASVICQAESSGNAQVLNSGCLTGRSYDYSVGLFQFNMLAHCDGALYGDGITCRVINQSKLDACLTQFKNPEYNIQRAVALSRNGTDWYSSWGAAGPLYCNIP